MILRSQYIRDGDPITCDTAFVECIIVAKEITFIDCVFIDCKFVYCGACAIDCVFIGRSRIRFKYIIDTKQFWCIEYKPDTIAIGCQCHRASEWAAFDDETIDQMSPHALRWWTRHKKKILSQHKRYFG